MATEQYFLIFKNNENNVIIVSRATIEEINQIIAQYNMVPEGYKIIRGSYV